MFVPTLSTRTTNVELMEDRRVFISQNFLTLGNYVVDPSAMHIDLVMRQQRHKLVGSHYYLSVKVTTADKSYMTVAISTRFNATILRARNVLKKQLLETSESRYRLVMQNQVNEYSQ